MTTLDEFRLTLPAQPGVYRFYDSRDQLLYVGKARHLKRRVNSYFQRELENPRLRLLVSQIQRIEITRTTSESEALLLESNLIKEHRPPFNIVFRDDKSYPYLQLTHHEFPRLTYFRGKTHGPHQYFGPYPHGAAAREIIQVLQKIFLLRTCEDNVFKNRSRPCLLYQIGRCSAPCVGQIGAEAYAQGVEQTARFLRGEEYQLRQQWADQMNQAAQQLDYETAAYWRDRIAMVQSLLSTQSVATQQDDEVDIVCLVQDQGETVVNLTMIRQGRHCGDRNLFPEHGQGASVSEVITAFMVHHYGEHRPQARLLCNYPCPDAALLDWLGQRRGARVRWIHQPQGVARAWMDGALRNAQGALQQRGLQQQGQQRRLQALQQALNLPRLPMRIECFDISHHRGSGTVASCVVFEQGKPLKSAYRRYTIDGVVRGDDLAAMGQALERRFRHAREDGVIPDLLLIDGGKGQLNVAQMVLDGYTLDLPLAALSKGPERRVGEEQIHRTGEAVLHLSPLDAGFHLLQAVRDEAHRFAVSGHHARIRRERRHTILEGIPGIGEKKRRMLLESLGGQQGLRQAAETDIARIPGIGERLAREIFVALHGAGNG